MQERKLKAFGPYQTIWVTIKNQLEERDLRPKPSAAKAFEPHRPQLLADEVRNLQAMRIDGFKSIREGKAPAFLDRADFRAAGSMTLEEEQAKCHAAWTCLLQSADAGKDISAGIQGPALT